MKLIKQLVALAALALAANAYAADNEAPDVLVRRISQETIDTVRSDKAIQAGDRKKAFDLVDTRILPYVDFQRMTSLAAGRYWRDGTPLQQKQLAEQFRTLLIFKYSGALQQLMDCKVEIQPSHFDPSAADGVEVGSRVIKPRGDPVPLTYRMEKTPSGWKIYDVNIMGAWLVETYKGEFSSEINKGGVDGLIKTLTQKNRQMADQNR